MSSDSCHDCAKYGRDQIHISIWTNLCENIKIICPVIFSRNFHVLTSMRILVKNSNYIISAPIHTRLPQIWSWPNSYIHKDPFVWKYQKNLLSDIFKKFLCTNPHENLSKTRTSLYHLQFNPNYPKYGLDQIDISIETYLYGNIKRNCPGIFSRNSRALTPLRIRQKLILHYICSDSVPIDPNMVVTKFIYPQGPIYVEISNETAQGYFQKIPV